MVVKDYFDYAVRNDEVDMQALIMFLVYEKKVLSFDDTKDKLMFYLQDKFKDRMNMLLKEYKKKLNLNYKPKVFEIQIEPNYYKVIYVIATNEKQATSFCFSQMYKPISLTICRPDKLMTTWNKKNEEVNLTIKELRDQTREVPSFLGGY